MNTNRLSVAAGQIVGRRIKLPPSGGCRCAIAPRTLREGPQSGISSVSKNAPAYLFLFHVDLLHQAECRSVDLSGCNTAPDGSNFHSRPTLWSFHDVSPDPKGLWTDLRDEKVIWTV